MAEGQELIVYATSLEHAPLVRALARAGYANGARYVEASTTISTSAGP